MFDFTPNPIAFHLGPVSVFWYGIGYAVGLAVAAWIIGREARRIHLDADLLPNGLIIVAVAALIGGRLYHVIDQWSNLYASDPIKVFLPPYTGLGAYGGIILGTIAGVAYARWLRQPVWRWADAVAPGLFAMQAVARWGNFFNQELYGPPTSLPWGIKIECQYRIAAYPCSAYPDTTHFQPLFLYESISGFLGLLALLWIGRRFATRLRAGDLFLGFLIWYSAVRFGLETFRADNWTFFGIPVAQIVSLATIVIAVAILAYRHRPGVVPEPWPPAVDDDFDDDEDWEDDEEDPDEGEPEEGVHEAARPAAGASRSG